ncbi:MAG: endonuclease III [Clostridia bacterium]
MDARNGHEIVQRLKQQYPSVRCTLDYETPIHLLIATQLSAQCTDERVNIVTRDLFIRYKTAEDFTKLDQETLIGYIRSTGFFNSKSRNILKSVWMIHENYSGEIPGNMEDLLKLPGVGRKTANVLLGELYGIPGIIVDTHAIRLSNRIGLTGETDPEKIERDLMKIIPREEWTGFSHRLVHHGRNVCRAHRPSCTECVIEPCCGFPGKRI